MGQLFFQNTKEFVFLALVEMALRRYGSSVIKEMNVADLIFEWAIICMV